MVNTGSGSFGNNVPEKKIKLSMEADSYLKSAKNLKSDNKEMVSSFNTTKENVEDFSKSLQSTTFNINKLSTSLTNLDDLALNTAKSPFVKLEKEAGTANEVFNQLGAATEDFSFKAVFGEAVPEIEKFNSQFGEFAEKAESVLGEKGIWFKFTESVQQFKLHKWLGKINDGIDILKEHLKNLDILSKPLMEKFEQFEKMLEKGEFGLKFINTMENIEDTLNSLKAGVEGIVETTGDIAKFGGALGQAGAAFAGVGEPLMMFQFGMQSLAFVTKGATQTLASFAAKIPLFEITSAIGIISQMAAEFTNLRFTLNEFDRGLEAMEISGVSSQYARFAKSLGIVGENLLFNIQATKKFVAASVRAWQELEKGIQILRTLSDAQKYSTETWANSIQELVSGSLQNAVASDEIVSNIYDSISAGAGNIKNALSEVEGAIKAAVATGSNLQSVQSAIQRIAKSTGQSMSNAEQIASKLISTVDKGMFTMQELSGVMGTLASTATALGFGMDNTLASTAKLSTLLENYDVALLRVMESMTKWSGAQEKLAKSFGINVQQLIKEYKDPLIVIHKIFEQLGGDLEKMRKLFPESISFRGVTAALKVDIENYKEGINEISEASVGRLDQLFEESQQTMQARMESLSNGFKEYFTRAGNEIVESGIFEKGIASMERFLDYLEDAPPWVEKLIGLTIQFNYALEKTLSIGGHLLKLTGMFIGLLAVVNFQRVIGALGTTLNIITNLSNGLTATQRITLLLTNTFRALTGATIINSEAMAANTAAVGLQNAVKDTWLGKKALELKAWIASTFGIGQNTTAQGANTTATIANTYSAKMQVVTIPTLDAVTKAYTGVLALNTTAKTVNTGATWAGTTAMKVQLVHLGNLKAAWVAFGSVFPGIQAGLLAIGVALKGLGTGSMLALKGLVKGISTILSGIVGTILAWGSALAAVVIIVKDLAALWFGIGDGTKKFKKDIEDINSGLSIMDKRMKEVNKEIDAPKKKKYNSWLAKTVALLGNVWNAMNWINEKLNFTYMLTKQFGKVAGWFGKQFNKGISVTAQALDVLGNKFKWLGNITDKVGNFFKPFSNAMKGIWNRVTNIGKGFRNLADNIELGFDKKKMDEYNKLVHTALDVKEDLYKITQDFSDGEIDTAKIMEQQVGILEKMEEEYQNIVDEKGKGSEAEVKASLAIQDQKERMKEVGEEMERLNELQQKRLDQLTEQEIKEKAQLQRKTLEVALEEQRAKLDSAEAVLKEAIAEGDHERVQTAKIALDNAEEKYNQTKRNLELVINAQEQQDLFLKKLRSNNEGLNDTLENVEGRLIGAMEKASQKAEEFGTDAVKQATNQAIQQAHGSVNLLRDIQQDLETRSTTVGKLQQRNANTLVNSYKDLNTVLLDIANKTDKDGNLIPLDPEEINETIESFFSASSDAIQSGDAKLTKQIMENFKELQVNVATESGEIIKESILNSLSPEQLKVFYEVWIASVENQFEKAQEKIERKIETYQSKINAGELGSLEGLQKINAEKEKLRRQEIISMEERLEIIEEQYGRESEEYKKAAAEIANLRRKRITDRADDIIKQIKEKFNQLKDDQQELIDKFQDDINTGHLDSLEGLKKINEEKQKLRREEIQSMKAHLKVVAAAYGKESEQYEEASEDLADLRRENRKALQEERTAELQAEYKKAVLENNQELIKSNVKVLQGEKDVLEFERQKLEVAKENSKEKISLIRQELSMLKKGTTQYQEKLQELGKAQKEYMESEIKQAIFEVNQVVKEFKWDFEKQNAQLDLLIKKSQHLKKLAEIQAQSREMALNYAKEEADIKIQSLSLEQENTNDLVEKAKIQMKIVEEESKLKKQEIEAQIENRKQEIKMIPINRKVRELEFKSEKLKLELKLKQEEVEIRIAELKKTVQKEEIEIMKEQVKNTRTELELLDERQAAERKQEELREHYLRKQMEQLEKRNELVNRETELAKEEAKQNIIMAKMDERIKKAKYEGQVLDLNITKLNTQLDIMNNMLKRQKEITSARQEVSSKIMDSIRTQASIQKDLIASEYVKAKRENDARERELKFIKLKQKLDKEMFELKESQELMSLKRQQLEIQNALKQEQIQLRITKLEAQKVMLSKDSTKEDKKIAQLQIQAQEQSVVAAQNNMNVIQQQVNQFEKMSSLRKFMFDTDQANEKFQVRQQALNPNADFEERKELREDVKDYQESLEYKFENINKTFEEFNLNQKVIQEPIKKMERLLKEGVKVRFNNTSMEQQFKQEVENRLQQPLNAESTPIESSVTINIEGNIDNNNLDSLVDKINKTHADHIWETIKQRL